MHVLVWQAEVEWAAAAAVGVPHSVGLQKVQRDEGSPQAPSQRLALIVAAEG